MLREDACDLVVEKYYQAIYRYCVHCLCGDVDAAEVCTQDVFLTLIEKQKKLNPDDNIRGWLYACADRITKDYLKRTARHRARCVSLASITNVQDPNALIDKSSPSKSSSVVFYYRKDNFLKEDALLNFHFTHYNADASIPPVGLSSDGTQSKEEIINGITMYTLKEDDQFSATFIYQNTVYVFFSRDLNYDECYKVVSSLAAVKE